MTPNEFNQYVKGKLVRIEGEFRDLDGILVDPALVTLRVLPPTGAALVYTWPTGQVSRDDVGKFSFDQPASLAGIWLYTWIATGPGESAENGSFFVSEQGA